MRGTLVSTPSRLMLDVSCRYCAPLMKRALRRLSSMWSSRNFTITIRRPRGGSVPLVPLTINLLAALVADLGGVLELPRPAPGQFVHAPVFHGDRPIRKVRRDQLLDLDD